MLWRRSYATPPPEIDPNDEYAQNGDPRYTGDPVPEAECLADVVKRVEPYFKSDIEPLLYELDENFKPIKPRGEYLDPEAAAAGAAAVAAQGQK